MNIIFRFLFELLDWFEIALVVAFKELIKVLAKELINRHKKGTAPTENRDGSNVNT